MSNIYNLNKTKKETKSKLRDHLKLAYRNYKDHLDIEVNNVSLIVETADGHVLHTFSNAGDLLSTIGALSVSKTALIDYLSQGIDDG